MKLIVRVIFKAIKLLINLVLLPLDLLVQSVAPDLTDIIASVNGFFTYITDAILWVKSWLPFTSLFWTLLASVLVFKYTVPMITHAIKVILAWYDTLKP